MAGERFVDVTYLGIELGRRLRLDSGASGKAYLHFNAPMPIGTALTIATDEGLSIPARVLEVQEQVAGAERPPGMKIRAGDLTGDAKTWWIELAGETPLESESETPSLPEPAQKEPEAENGAPESDSENEVPENEVSESADN